MSNGVCLVLLQATRRHVHSPTSELSLQSRGGNARPDTFWAVGIAISAEMGTF